MSVVSDEGKVLCDFLTIDNKIYAKDEILDTVLFNLIKDRLKRIKLKGIGESSQSINGKTINAKNISR